MKDNATLAQNIAVSLPDIRSKAISSIERLIFSSGKEIKIDERRRLAALIFKKCIHSPMSVSDDYGNMVHEINDILCYGEDVLKLAVERKLKITTMFTDYANVRASVVLNDLADLIINNVKRSVFVRVMNRHFKSLSKDNGEVYDSAVRDEFCFYLDRLMKIKGMEILNLDDFKNEL